MKLKPMRCVEEDVFPMLPLNISNMLQELPKTILMYLEEVRLRPTKPLMLTIKNKDFFVTSEGDLTHDIDKSYKVSREDVLKTFHFMSQCSIYAIEEELKNGYITISGGHRVGIVGKVVIEKGEIKTLKYISGLNIRIAREIIGIADDIVPYIIDKAGNVLNTLIVSPPKAGKTTLLRDLIRQLSSGLNGEITKGFKVGLVDERSEIACCFEGIPQNDVGIRTDVLDACPKAQGIIMMLRSMSPDVIATDEIGSKEDVEAIEEAINAGVSIMATVHGKDLEDIQKRPSIRELISSNFFEIYIILGFSRGVGSVEAILEGKSFKSLKYEGRV